MKRERRPRTNNGISIVRPLSLRRVSFACVRKRPSRVRAEVYPLSILLAPRHRGLLREIFIYLCTRTFIKTAGIGEILRRGRKIFEIVIAERDRSRARIFSPPSSSSRLRNHLGNRSHYRLLNRNYRPGRTFVYFAVVAVFSRCRRRSNRTHRNGLR